jgi:hypothetical protein
MMRAQIPLGVTRGITGTGNMSWYRKAQEEDLLGQTVKEVIDDGSAAAMGRKRVDTTTYSITEPVFIPGHCYEIVAVNNSTRICMCYEDGMGEVTMWGDEHVRQAIAAKSKDIGMSIVFRKRWIKECWEIKCPLKWKPALKLFDQGGQG